MGRHTMEAKGSNYPIHSSEHSISDKTDLLHHYHFHPDVQEQEQVVAPTSLSDDTILLVLFLLVCVMLGVVVKVVIITVKRWRKRREIRQIDIVYSTTT